MTRSFIGTIPGGAILAAGSRLPPVADDNGIGSRRLDFDLRVSEAAPLLTETVTIAGLPVQGGRLTASNSISEADGLGDISYQWFADGEDAGVGPELTLEQEHVGKHITVTARYLNGAGEFSTAESRATRAVANVNDPPALSDPAPVSIATDAANNPDLTTGRIVVDDPDGDDLGFFVAGGRVDSVTGMITRAGSFGTLAVNPDTGEFTYSPSADKLGAATGIPLDLFTVSVSDGGFVDTGILEVGQFDEYTVNVIDPSDDGRLRDASIAVVGGETLSAEDLQLFRTYSGVLGRAPDTGGFAFYQEKIESGEHDLHSMTTGFLWSREFLSFFPGATRPTDIDSADFVNHIYLNVFGREADAGGFAYWTHELDSGNRDLANVAVSMTQSNEFVALTAMDAVDYLIG